MSFHRICGAAVITLVLTTSTRADDRCYSVVNFLDTGAETWNSTTAAAINQGGQVAGSGARISAGQSHALLWLPTAQYGFDAGIADLGELLTAIAGFDPDSFATSINDAGQVVGYFMTDTGFIERHIFLWLPAPAFGLGAGMHDLGTFGGFDAIASDINNAGQIVGYFLVNDGGNNIWHAFLWDQGAFTDLGNFGGPEGAFADAINDLGDIAGHRAMDNASGEHPTEAFVYHLSSQTVEFLPGIAGPRTAAFDINNFGEVAGGATAYQVSGGDDFATGIEGGTEMRWVMVPVRWINGAVQTLGPIQDPNVGGAGYSINDFGQIVGEASGRAFLYIDNHFVDLSERLLPGSGFGYLASATAISAQGEIVGHGHLISPGQRWGYVLGTATLVPLEGGVRVAACIPPELATDPPPRVQVFYDADGDGTLSEGEVGADARFVSVRSDSAGGYFLYYTPPPFDPQWPPPENGRRAVAVRIGDGGTVLDLASYHFYVDDVQSCLNEIATGLRCYLDELLRFASSEEVVATAPTAGAMAEVGLQQLLRRTPVLSTAERSAVEAALRGWPVATRDLINARRPAGFPYTAAVRPITNGQVIHQPYRDLEDVVVLTLATGTLTLVPGLVGAPDPPPADGRFILPGDLPQQGTYVEEVWTAIPNDWHFWFEVTAERGVEIQDLAIYDNLGLEYVAPRLGLPTISAWINVEPWILGLRLADFSHLYIDEEIPVGDGARHDGPTAEWILTAVYRINLNGAETIGNQVRPALVVRQSYAFTLPFVDFEPTHCLRSAQAFPRATLNVSVPVDEVSTPPVSRVRCDHRLALAPQDETPAVRGDGQYLAAIFRDRDDIPWWVDPPFMECLPLPFWANLFHSPADAPAEHEMFFDSADTDNIHLHHVHDETCLWTGPTVEAPGSFNGTMHLHWRWSADFGAEFGAAEPLMPLSQSWQLGLARDDFPVQPLPDFTQVLAQRIAVSGGGGYAITTAEKVLLIGCEQNAVQPARQYETLSTGFSYALNAEGLICAMTELAARLGGYCLFKLGFNDPLGAAALDNIVGFLDFLGQLTDCGQGPDLRGADPNSDWLPPMPVTCAMVTWDPARVGETTPLTLAVDGTAVDFSAAPQSGALVIAPNVFTHSLGYMLGEPDGASGSTLTVDFAPPVRVLRHLPVAANAESAVLLVEAFDAGDPVSSRPVLARTPPGASAAQAFVSIDPGAAFDRVTIRTVGPDIELAISRFQICSAPPLLGDLDFDDAVGITDLERFTACMHGPDDLTAFQCRDPDLNDDGDVDLGDLAVLQAAR